MSAADDSRGGSYIFRIMGDPEDWVSKVEAGEEVDFDTEPAPREVAFGALSANYWHTSVVWYDTASSSGGRIMDDKTRMIWFGANVINTQGSSMVCAKVVIVGP